MLAQDASALGPASFLDSDEDVSCRDHADRILVAVTHRHVVNSRLNCNPGVVIALLREPPPFLLRMTHMRRRRRPPRRRW